MRLDDTTAHGRELAIALRVETTALYRAKNRLTLILHEHLAHKFTRLLNHLLLVVAYSTQ